MRLLLCFQQSQAFLGSCLNIWKTIIHCFKGVWDYKNISKYFHLVNFRCQKHCKWNRITWNSWREVLEDQEKSLLGQFKNGTELRNRTHRTLQKISCIVLCSFPQILIQNCLHKYAWESCQRKLFSELITKINCFTYTKKKTLMNLFFWGRKCSGLMKQKLNFTDTTTQDVDKDSQSSRYSCLEVQSWKLDSFCWFETFCYLSK